MKNQTLSKIALTTIGVGLLAGAISSSWAGTTVSASFIGRNDANVFLAPSDVAGVVPQAYWANIDQTQGSADHNNGPYIGISDPLRDSAGNWTSVQLVYVAQDSWVSDGPTVTPNDKMMKGIIKVNTNSPAGYPYPANNAQGTLVFTNVPAGNYDLYAYCTENGTGSQGHINGPQGASTVYVNWTNTFTGTFTEAVSGNPDGNYVHFASVSPDANGALDLSIVWDAAGVNDGVGIAGLQLVQNSGTAFGVNGTHAVITTQPVNVTNVATTTEGPPATFTVGVTGPHWTIWKTNGVAVPGANLDSYTTPGLTTANNGMTVQAVVTNNLDTLNSSVAVAHVLLNTVACAITADPVSTLTVEGSTANFNVGYSGPFVHFQWTKNGANIAGATAASLNYTAALSDNNAVFRVIVYNNVNTNTSAPATLSVDANTPPVLTQGYLKFERWENIGANGGQQGINDVIAVLGTPPTASSYLPGPDQPQSVPDLSNFGTRMMGWVSPTVTGDYWFFIRSDDASALYLNPNPAGAPGQPNTLPDFSSPIANVFGACCSSFQETNINRSETSVIPFHLQAGYLYGFIMLFKEIGGGDYAQCAWRLDGDTTPAATLHTIPPANCYAMASSAGHRFAITRQPQSITVVQDRPAYFSVGVSNFPVTDVTGVQWYSNNVAIPGATKASLTIPETFWPADSGKQFFARFYTLSGIVNSSNALLTVVQDTNPPVPAATTTTSAGTGHVTIGIGFDEPVNPAGLISANFTCDAPGAVWDAKTNSLNTYTGATFEVSSLLPGTTYHVHVSNISDKHGNAIPAAGVTVPFTLGSGTWANSGTQIRPGQVVPVGNDGFDILNGGRQDWGTYDEITIAYVKKTNDFDVKVRVMYAEPGSEWTRVGLRAENDLNLNEPSDDRNSASGTASAYAQTHVNPSQTLASSGVWDPAAHIQPGNPTPNNGHEQNTRLGMGIATTGWGSPGTAPTYPNAWLRLQRSGTTLHGYRSEDGTTWVDQGTVVLTDQQPVMYVGPFLAVETGNIWSGSLPDGFNVWTDPFDPLYDRLFLAQFRDFGDVTVAAPPVGLTISKVGANVVVSWTSGVLQSAPTLGATFTDVAGVTGTSYTIPPSGTQQFFRLRGTQ